MAVAQTTGNMSPKLMKVARLAKQDPQQRFNSLAHMIDEEMLRRSFERLRPNAAPGIDGMTKEQYARGLENRLRDLHGRLKAKRYRHQPIRRVQIPKASGKKRPIGISSVEDKIVQGALVEVLSAIYEQDFLDCSYGFRPGRSAHDALRSLNRVLWEGKGNWLIEADIQAYFDSLDRAQLVEMLKLRIADGSLLRLVGKCLKVGVLDGEEFSTPESGTAQGSILSPLLGNIYLHHVLDLWFEQEVRPRLRGQAEVIRYADDFVIVFEDEADARRVMEVLGKRMGRYNLQLHPEKTRLLPVGRPRGPKDKGGPSTFDFLGFTVFWRKSREGRWRVGLKTRRASVRRFLASITDWCRRHRHLPVKAQQVVLCQKLNGYNHYFGVNGNIDGLAHVRQRVRRIWQKWLSRRSQRSLGWETFCRVWDAYPLPRPRVWAQIWLRT